VGVQEDAKRSLTAATSVSSLASARESLDSSSVFGMDDDTGFDRATRCFTTVAQEYMLGLEM
jgi:hypothetical protein